MPKIGAHVSAATSLDLSFQRALNIEAEATQIFISPPRQWSQINHSEEIIESYKKAALESKISPNFIHGTYLINLGTQSPEHLKKSIDWLIWAMRMAGKLGSIGVIFHIGSHRGRGFEEVKEQVVNSLRQILKTVISSVNEKSADSSSSTQNDNKPFLVLENPVATGGNIGSSLEELGWILKEVNPPNLRICLDTQHAFASGYDLKTPEGLNNFLEEFDREVGLQNLVAIHANDSKVEFNSKRDRHENIGDGFLGLDGFTNLINHPKLKDIPFILEVPGFSKSGPDLENVQRLKSLKKV